MIWPLLAILSATGLGFYDVTKKLALKRGSVIFVLTFSVCINALFVIPMAMHAESVGWQGQLLILAKAALVLVSWLCSYTAIKYLPLSVVSPIQATRPMWTLLGALVIFGEVLNGWQWSGVILALGSIFLFSLSPALKGTLSPNRFAKGKGEVQSAESENRGYYIVLALAVLTGAMSGLYDKYIMRRLDHNAVQAYYTFYQALMMLVVYGIDEFRGRAERYSLECREGNGTSSRKSFRESWSWWIPAISLLLVVSDYLYFVALSDPTSMISVMSTIRRSGTIIPFLYGLIFLKEKDPWRKILTLIGVMIGLVLLVGGTI